ncbi:MAG: hypothetical protein HND27_04675 [Bacteroidetes bacterium]|nr:hypothetical protein [Bacteroidota bacterium]MBV6461870.1 hypothetical protein [Flavobacteriales bacterium]WKZ74440.1 MAG: hypothetical protein QY303_09825 [Vicingaceae bacterium]MCL4816167.1 hypothetical protein [Flavobacteriales bacterium]NOG95053.1 hypothetical protein [Bacteroidota bacterium]
MKINLQYIFNWLLPFALIWIVIDGVFRKWVFPQWSTPIFTIKYILFLLVYGVFFLYTHFFVPRIKYFYQVIIAILFVWCTLHFFYSAFPTSMLVKVFGIINYLFFIPLTLVVPYYFNSIGRIESLIKFLAYISIPIFIIGIVQYFLPTDHILNYLPNEDQKINKVAEFTRSLSIFSFVKIYNVYLLFIISTFTSYIFYLINAGRNSWFYVTLLVFAILNMFMTGSRLPLFVSLAFIVIICIFIFFQIRAMRKSILVTAIVGLCLSFLLYNYSNTMKTAVDAFFKRVEFVEAVAEKGIKNYSAKSRLLDRVTIFKYSEQAGLLGFGIGTTYQGTGSVLVNHRTDVPFEEEGERVVLEIGVIGGVVLLLLRFFVLIYSLNVLLKIKDIQFALLIIPFVIYLIPSVLFLGNNTFNYFDGYSYWFAFAMVIAIANIYQHRNLQGV